MGYDRGTLPPDRDEPETRLQGKRLLVAVVVIALALGIVIYAMSLVIAD
ncbi:MAG TPA: hypothetical protein VGC03_10880 [Acidimicrobiia bacterium]|jgi:hypothetical protein